MNKENKTVIITGASGNLGNAVTKTFLNKGYKVIATAINEKEKKDLPVHENLHTEIVDLSNEEAAASFIQTSINSHGKIDATMMLVGGFAPGSILETKSEDIKKQIALNFETAYHVARPVFQHMLGNNSGRLIFIGARPALVASQGKNLIAYGLSKSLLFKLAEYLNAEAKGKNVTATVVALSTLDTDLNRKSMPDTNPDNWVKPEAAAEVLEFICSDIGSPLRETVLKVYNNA